jgi:DDE superfamily endonuclease
MHHVILQDLQIRNLQQQRTPRVYKPRIDPTEVLNDFEFKRTFRFEKNHVCQLAELLRLQRPTDRGLPITPVQSVCLALNQYAGAHFTRVSAYCGNVSYHAAWSAIDRVTDALCDLKNHVIRLPTEREMEGTARRMYAKYQLPGFAYAVDGMLVRFDGAPRSIPEGPGLPNLQNFFTRKMFYGLNAMVIANDRKLILGLDVDWHGAAHDARIWRMSRLKRRIERRRGYYLAGDSAYPISDVLVKPYPNQEAIRDQRKRLFNSRLCGLRTEMSENVFGIWKQRFPCLRSLRCHYEKAKKMIIATAVLHNLAILLNEEELDEDLEIDGDLDDDQYRYEIVEDYAEPAAVRERGNQLRDTLCNRMPLRRRRERVV